MQHTKQQHTPGPWSVQKSRFGLSVIKENHWRGGNRPICESIDYKEVLNPDEDRANAHLIAAAPEMLEALEAINTELKRVKSECEPNSAFGHAYRMIDTYATKGVEAAINKAKGV